MFSLNKAGIMLCIEYYLSQNYLHNTNINYKKENVLVLTKRRSEKKL